MLVLSRRLGEEVVIAGTIRVTIVAAGGDRARIGIAAPPPVTVKRKEVHDRRAERATGGMLRSDAIDPTGGQFAEYSGP